MRVRALVRTVVTSRIAPVGLSLISFFIVLELGVGLFWPQHRYIFRPTQILMAYPSAQRDGLWVHAFATVLRTLEGFLVVTLAGVTVGVLIGRSRVLRSLCQPIIDFFRPLPSAAIIPIVMLFFGFGEATYLTVIVFGGLWPVLLATVEGVRYVNPAAKASIQQLHLSKLRTLTLFILPEASPQIVTGMKVSLSICLILAITAEMLVGKQSGLGRFLHELEASGDYRGMWLTVVVIAILGFLLNQIFILLEKVTPWLRHQYETEV